VFFEHHVIESMTMGGVISRVWIFPIMGQITAMMCIMFYRTVSGNGVQKGFRMVVMGHQVVTQESGETNQK